MLDIGQADGAAATWRELIEGPLQRGADPQVGGVSLFEPYNLPGNMGCCWLILREPTCLPSGTDLAQFHAGVSSIVARCPDGGRRHILTSHSQHYTRDDGPTDSA